MSGLRASQRRTVFMRDNGVCHYCEEPVGLAEGTVDHVWPRVLGGGDCNTNLVWSCRPCNEGFGSRIPKCECAFCRAALVGCPNPRRVQREEPTAMAAAFAAALEAKEIR